MQIRAQLRLFQVKSHVQTAHESHDLNMDFAASNSFAYNKFPCKNAGLTLETKVKIKKSHTNVITDICDGPTNHWQSIDPILVHYLVE